MPLLFLRNVNVSFPLVKKSAMAETLSHADSAPDSFITDCVIPDTSSKAPPLSVNSRGRSVA